MKILNNIALIFVLSARLLWTGDVSGQGIATLTLQTRYETMLRTEVQQYVITMRNDSSSNLLHVSDRFEFPEKQLFMRVRKGDKEIRERTETPPYVITEKSRSWDKIMKLPTSILPPGQSVTWRAVDMGRDWPTELGDCAIQARVMIGPDQWASSQEIHVNFLSGIVDDFPKVFTYDYVLGLGTNRMWFYQGAVGDKEYLFSMGRFRICEVPKGSTPKFLYKPETYSIRISFEGVNVPDVIYDQRKRQVLSPEEFNQEHGQKHHEPSKRETKEGSTVPGSGI